MAAIVAALAVPALLAAQEPELRPTALPTSVTVDGGVTDFSDATETWRQASASLGRSMPWGSIIGRVNWASRFGADGLQFETDAYPSLGSGMYAYVNLGYSNAGIYPRWRSGAELYVNLPRAFEASVGYRQLRFGGPPVTLFTGTVGKYTGNYWFSVRPFLRDKPSGLSASASLTARRYTIDADHHVGARIGYGSTPSDRVIESELTRNNTFTAGLHGSRVLRGATFLLWSASFDREELDRGTTRNRLDGNLGIKVRF